MHGHCYKLFSCVACSYGARSLWDERDSGGHLPPLAMKPQVPLWDSARQFPRASALLFHFNDLNPNHRAAAGKRFMVEALKKEGGLWGRWEVLAMSINQLQPRMRLHPILLHSRFHQKPAASPGFWAVRCSRLCGASCRLHAKRAPPLYPAFAQRVPQTPRFFPSFPTHKNMATSSRVPRPTPHQSPRAPMPWSAGSDVSTADETQPWSPVHS